MNSWDRFRSVDKTLYHYGYLGGSFAAVHESLENCWDFLRAPTRESQEIRVCLR